STTACARALTSWRAPGAGRAGKESARAPTPPPPNRARTRHPPPSAPPPPRAPQLTLVSRAHDELALAAPPGHPAARRARCPLAVLDGQPFIGFDRDIPTRRLVRRLLGRHR